MRCLYGKSHDMGRDSKKYPDQWVGLVDVEWCPDNTATVKSAVIKYTDKSKDELTIMMLRGEIDARYTTPDNFFNWE